MPFLSKPVEQTGGERMIHYQFDPFLLKLAHSNQKRFRRPCRRMPWVNIRTTLACNGNRCTKAGLNRLHQGNNKPSPIWQFYGLAEKSAKALFLSKSNSIHSCASALAIAGAIIKTQKTGQTQQDSGRVPTIPSGHLNCSGTPPIYV